jgi:hypothetical protein
MSTSTRKGTYMKKNAFLTTLVVIALAVPMMASAAGINGKNACLLNSENCSDTTMSIVQVIGQLKKEIGKGPAVYSADELKLLSSKLTEYKDFMIKMQQG